MTEGDRLRQRIFDALEQRLSRGEPTMSYDELANFVVDGERRRLRANSKGIWNPQWLDETLTIYSAMNSPYSDQELSPGIWRYDYQARSTDGDNTKLRRAFERQTPIIWIKEVAKGVYVPHFPVYVIDDNTSEKFFTIAIEEIHLMGVPESEDSRRYVQQTVKRRIHQREFRGKVLHAYENRCAVCRLAHPELLDAAHIIPDSHERGVAAVTNGLSMCKIHHSAYDANFLGIDSNYRVHINRDLLHEQDGPMLKHGLQEMHGSLLTIPRASRLRPDKSALDQRFEAFQSA